MKKVNNNFPLYLISFLLFIIIVQYSNPQTNVTNEKTKQRIPYFNYNTQRVEPFTRIGVLYKENSATILPLYGRRTHVRSNTWNYYTETNDENRIRIELNIKNRQCLRNTGCKELYNGDAINIPEYNGVFTVKLYL